MEENKEEVMLMTPQVAKMLGVKRNTLEQARSLGVGEYPPFIRVGRRGVRYRLSDVEEFIKRRSYNNDASPVHR